MRMGLNPLTKFVTMSSGAPQAHSNDERTAGIFKRFQESLERSELAKAEVGEGLKRKREESEDYVKHGLTPLPQPENAEDDIKSFTLPWPVEPELVEPKRRAGFQSLGVFPGLVEKLSEAGYREAFAVQVAVIPNVIKDNITCIGPDPLPDILVNSFTGSGKTLAYVVPILDRLFRCRIVPRIRALIVLPTRPLMLQVHQIIEFLTRGTPIEVTTLRNDRSFQKENQLLTGTNPPDIVITAPGRLVDHLAATPKVFGDLEYIVIDEADRLVGQSFQDWTNFLSTMVVEHPGLRQNWRRPPQRLIFSATLTRDPGKLKALQVRTVPKLPRLYVVGDYELTEKEFSVPTTLQERIVKVRSTTAKPLALVQKLLSASPKFSRVMVFVRSNEATVRLARLMEIVASRCYQKDLTIGRCSREMLSSQRKDVLRAFESGSFPVLVCTDLIARGLDVEGVDLIVNYDLPAGAREYIHRVGRTARAGADGEAWTFSATGGETKFFYNLQTSISRKNDIGEDFCEVDELDKDYDGALRELEQEVTGS